MHALDHDVAVVARITREKDRGMAAHTKFALYLVSPQVGSHEASLFTPLELPGPV